MAFRYLGSARALSGSSGSSSCSDFESFSDPSDHIDLPLFVFLHPRVFQKLSIRGSRVRLFEKTIKDDENQLGSD
jgi:hypothetical protein